MSNELKIEDGGPAFPRPPFTPKDSHDQFAQAGFAATGHPGMTLRDWFAGQALAGLCQNWNENPMNTKSCADVAYDLADAMLERRKK